MFPSPDDIDPAPSDVQGVEVECAEDPNCGEVTYNTCMAAYQASLGSGKKDGRSIWIDKSGVELICAVLTPDTRVLEFGSGGSTTLFSPFVKQWISIEHNTYWAETVENTLKNLSLSDKVSVYTVPNDLPWKWGQDGTEAQFQAYLKFPTTLGGKYDFIMNDGRARRKVSQFALSHKWLASSSSRLIIHDWERSYYKPMVTELGYRLEREDIKN